MRWLMCLLALTVSVTLCLADLPVECLYSDVVGDWQFFETKRDGDNNIKCNGETPYVFVKNISLHFPNTAHDEFGNEGTWTMVYDQGFEVRIAGRSYFAFSKFIKKNGNITSECGLTFPGWSRDFTIRNWSCFVGKKLQKVESKVRTIPDHLNDSREFKQNQEFVDEINRKQSSWTAKMYPQFEGLTVKDVYRMSGAQTLKRAHMMEKRTSSIDRKLEVSMLPRHFDWRNVAGVNYVRPVKNQGNCGSCYAFASIGVLESQLLINSNANTSLDLSAEDVVGCSKLSQGCDGGFPYLVAGRYAQDNGMVSADCVPYDISPVCNKKRNSCHKYYTLDYGYVGGYYGGCNEDEMLIDLVRVGPLAVGIEVGEDFINYSGGIYHKITKSVKAGFDPLEETNHAVLIVGYGISDEGEKYWIVQNSWGTAWGLQGYFLIRRGTDEIGIESLAVKAKLYS